MSNLDVADMEHILSLPHGKECAANQVLYNLKERGIEYDLVPWSERHAIPIMAYTPLGEGRLRNHRTLAGIASRHNALPRKLCWHGRCAPRMSLPYRKQAASLM